MVRRAGLAALSLIVVGCAGEDCGSKSSALAESGFYLARVKSINASLGTEGHLDFRAGSAGVGSNLGLNQHGGWTKISPGTVTVSTAIHGTTDPLATRTLTFQTARSYWILAYDGDPSPRIMAGVHPGDFPPDGTGLLLFMNGDHVRGSLDIHVTSGGPPAAGSLVVADLAPGESEAGVENFKELAPGTWIVYGVKHGTLEEVWSVAVTVGPNMSYLVAPLSSGGVPYDPNPLEIPR